MTKISESAIRDYKPEAEISQAEFELGVQFLLADFNSIREFKKQSVAIGDKRVDVFLALASGLVAGVGLLSQSSIDGRSFLLVTLLGSLSLLAVGIVVLRQVIDRDILIVDYIRAINRIRKYFAEEAPQLQPFLLMPTAHEYPPYRWPSSNRQIPMVINSLSAGMSAVVIDLLVQPGAPLTLAPVLIGSALFLVVYILQIAYANRLFDRAERKARESRSVSLFESHSVFRRGMAGGSYAHHHTNRSSETTPDA